jgi:signal peptide peptidase SppA
MAKRTANAAVEPMHPVHRLARQYLAANKWAMRQEMLDVIGSILHLRSIGVDLSDKSRIELAALRDARIAHRATDRPGVAMLAEQMTAEDVQASVTAARRSSTPLAGAVAVIPLCGVIDQKIGSMADISGGTSVDGFMKQFRQCLNDPGVAGIVIDADTPGGNVSGVPEAAAEILAARGAKPIVAVADPMIASAGYYLCCAADEVVCMPSGEVGSIGVLAVHDDFSAQNEMVGYKPTYISFGTYKTELNPDTPLSPDALAYQQQQIDAIGNDFVRFVARARNLPVDTVRSSFGQGRMLLAKEALAAKMIDRIETLDAAIARVGRLAKAQSTPVQSGARAAVAGVVPADVSEERAPQDAPWSTPTLGDFTDSAWMHLSDAEKQRIAGHYAWAAAVPPAHFTDLALPHHRPSDGKIVYAGVVAAARRLARTELPTADRAAVTAHLRRQWLAFGGSEQELPESLKGVLLEHFRVAVEAEQAARAASQPLALDPQAQDAPSRFSRLLSTLSGDQVSAAQASIATMTDDAEATALLETLVAAQLAAQVDAEALDLTMRLRSRA